MLRRRFGNAIALLRGRLPAMLLPCAFCPSAALPRPRRPRATCSLLSAPFPLPDLFAYPTVAFARAAAGSDWRPELLGASLWSAGLYLGFSETERWGSNSLAAATRLCRRQMPLELAEGVAAAFHSLPFLAAGFGIDAALRYSSAGNAVWAVASGLTVFLYSGVYELGRSSSRRARELSPDEEALFALFEEFAACRLAPRGRCHLVDVRAALRKDPKARRVANVSDANLRRFISNRYPKAIRSRNGFYRGLRIIVPSPPPTSNDSP